MTPTPQWDQSNAEKYWRKNIKARNGEFEKSDGATSSWRIPDNVLRSALSSVISELNSHITITSTVFSLVIISIISMVVRDISTGVCSS